MSVLVLGGTGFVGRNVCECLTENQIVYRTISRTMGTDLRNEDSFLTVLRQELPNVIINCAAHVGSLNYVTQQAAKVIVDNSKMILTMYEAAAKICPEALIINPIANCAYPAKADIFLEDRWMDGPVHRSVLSYGATRRFLWEISECFNMQYGMRSISLLVPNMYGPYDSTDPNKAHALNALVSKFVHAEKTRQSSIEIWGTGIAIREWLYAKDFGEIILKILKNPKMIGLSEPVNIAQNYGLSVRELVEIIQQHFNYSGKIVFDETKPDGAPKKVMDDQRFKKVFGDFAFTQFSDGIRKTIDYYRQICL
ncbi:NAD-dependent epimerase/dehydratase family protein [Sporomusa malonica]|uniref:GDP-L-fucose synthase n=1 Tax=Sporomusa malonica TaxID=112901 RepID=A0A1W2EMZ9_9FIRM|nr:NAD-dependent epimerase/dehydratase family protein [Sporomusa malonica]SMD10902.1 GDP-L-fucose synthase [Sporomusa malonica]